MQGLCLRVCAVVVGILAPVVQASLIPETPEPQERVHLDNGNLRSDWSGLPSGQTIDLGGITFINQLAQKEAYFQITDATSNFIGFRVGDSGFPVVLSVNNQTFQLNHDVDSVDFSDLIGGSATSFTLTFKSIVNYPWPSLSPSPSEINESVFEGGLVPVSLSGVDPASLSGVVLAPPFILISSWLPVTLLFDTQAASFGVERTNWLRVIPEPTSSLLLMGLSILFMGQRKQRPNKYS